MVQKLLLQKDFVNFNLFDIIIMENIKDKIIEALKNYEGSSFLVNEELLEFIESTSTEKNTYRVVAKVTTYCFLEVVAETEQNAIEIAEKTDGGDFISQENEGEFEIISVTKNQKP